MNDLVCPKCYRDACKQHVTEQQETPLQMRARQARKIRELRHALTAGAIIGATAPRYYYAPAPVYVAPAPVYAARLSAIGAGESWCGMAIVGFARASRFATNFSNSDAGARAGCRRQTHRTLHGHDRRHGGGSRCSPDRRQRRLADDLQPFHACDRRNKE